MNKPDVCGIALGNGHHATSGRKCKTRKSLYIITRGIVSTGIWYGSIRSKLLRRPAWAVDIKVFRPQLFLLKRDFPPHDDSSTLSLDRTRRPRKHEHNNIRHMRMMDILSQPSTLSRAVTADHPLNLLIAPYSDYCKVP